MSPSKSALFAIVFLLAWSASALAQTNVRGWNKNGQSWIVWDTTNPEPVTYDIYKSAGPITNISSGELVGRVFPEDYQARRLKVVGLTLTWTIPAQAGGTYKLSSGEGVFAYTPHSAHSAYFSVVKHDETAVTAANRVGPISQSLDPIQCYIQKLWWSEWGSWVSVWAFWIDGRADYDSGRGDFPVMGNQHENGTATIFAVGEPIDGRPDNNDPVPAVVALHGSALTSSYLDMISGVIGYFYLDMTLSDAVLVSMDDHFYCTKLRLGSPDVQHQNTRWFGYWKDYDRFTVPTGTPPDGSLIIDYTVRKSEWITDWMIEHDNWDPERISLFGFSGGCAGTNYLAKSKPDRYSAILNYVAVFSGWEEESIDNLLGSKEQNLLTNMYGKTTVELLWPTLDLTGLDAPFTRFVHGKRDESEPWLVRVTAYNEMNDLRTGAMMFWDQRMHAVEYEDKHWNESPRLQAQSLTRFFIDQSYPAFSNDDQDIATPGRQQTPGNGDPDNGDPWGTWGGYFDWDVDTISDNVNSWAATIWLVDDSPFENDNAPFNVSTTDVSIRRPQNFTPAPADTVNWELIDPAGRTLYDSGQVTVDGDGLVTVIQISITKTPRRLTFAVPDDDDDDDDDTTPDDDDDDDDDETTAFVPAGSFYQGCEPNNPIECPVEETPRHLVTLTSGFRMHLTEVTNAEYAQYLNDQNSGNDCDGHQCIGDVDEIGGDKGIYFDTQWKVDSGYEHRPAVYVSWYGAKAYCEAMGMELPTESQWELSAKGADDHYIFPWGDAWAANASNHSANSDPYESGSSPTTTPVGFFNGSLQGAYQTLDGRSPYGLFDMAGNAWEWVADHYGADYYNDATEDWIDPTGPQSGDTRVAKGGAWNGSQTGQRNSKRISVNPESLYNSMGFRCANLTLDDDDDDDDDDNDDDNDDNDDNDDDDDDTTPDDDDDDDDDTTPDDDDDNDTSPDDDDDNDDDGGSSGGGDDENAGGCCG